MTSTDGIQLRHPLPDDLIGTRLTLAAIGTAFEASYGWHLLVDGAVEAIGYFQAGSMGVMEAFVHEAPLTVGHLGDAVLQVWGDDPSGENPPPGNDVVTVPVILVPGMVGYQVHQVVPGDTLSRIARDYGSSVQRVVVANRIPNPDLIRVGQVLRIPV
jgi:nucleoid-associated protein YgaU